MGRTVCFSCRRSLEQEDDLHVLTGTCPAWFKELLASRDGKLSAYLESLDVPAALVSPDHIILEANSRFRDAASRQDAVGLRVGEALDCMYAPLLGRCGETVACLLCGLRKSVEHTWLTGEGLRRVPLSFPHKAESRKAFAITTEKIGGAVLLLMTSP